MLSGDAELSRRPGDAERDAELSRRPEDAQLDSELSRLPALTRRCQKVPPSACESLPAQLGGRYRLQSRLLIEINGEGTICPTIVGFF